MRNCGFTEFVLNVPNLDGRGDPIGGLSGVGRALNVGVLTAERINRYCHFLGKSLIILIVGRQLLEYFGQ